tara:strand:+ start:11393 stop:12871 length:1479 start_codon:yes stop_codon:yes gene_type:complete
MTNLILFFVLATSAFGQVTRAEVGEALQAAQAAEEQVKIERETLSELETAAQVQRETLREASTAAIAAEKAFRQIFQAYLDGMGPPASDSRPGEELDWSVRERPSVEQIDWIVQGGKYTSRRGLKPATNYGDAYRASRASNDLDIIFGVFGDSGRAMVGGLYGTTGGEDLAAPGDEKASACFVGLDDTASIELGFGSHLNRGLPTGSVWAFDIGLRGPSDTFLIRANGGSDHVQLDGCWWLGVRGWDYTSDANAYASGLHIDNWGTLVLRNHQWRGETPGSPGLKLREHQFYLKSGRISTLIENNDLFGGNRSGFQRRPDMPNQELPTDRIMIRGNRCDGHGSNHEHSDGGGVLTVWLSNPATYVYDNVVTNFRYQALVVSGQGTELNFDFLGSGNQHGAVYVAGNTFIPGPITERDTASLSSIDELHLWGDNEMVGTINLDSVWNWENNSTSNLREYIYATAAPLWHLVRYIPGEGDYVLTTEDKEALLVR